MFNLPKGPFCQSCGMPINDENLLGLEKNGAKNSEFCMYCYKDGGFVNPDMTIDEMIDKATQILASKKSMPKKQAAMLVNMVIPKLKRWTVK